MSNAGGWLAVDGMHMDLILRDIRRVQKVAGDCVLALNQALFARNGQFCINEKRAVAAIAGFALAPAEYQSRVDAVSALLGRDAVRALDTLGALSEEAGISMASF